MRTPRAHKKVKGVQWVQLFEDHPACVSVFKAPVRPQAALRELRNSAPEALVDQRQKGACLSWPIENSRFLPGDDLRELVIREARSAGKAQIALGAGTRLTWMHQDSMLIDQKTRPTGTPEKAVFRMGLPHAGVAHIMITHGQKTNKQAELAVLQGDYKDIKVGPPNGYLFPAEYFENDNVWLIWHGSAGTTPDRPGRVLTLYDLSGLPECLEPPVLYDGNFFDPTLPYDKDFFEYMQCVLKERVVSISGGGARART